VQNILNVLDVAAQKAVAAPEIAQGVSPAQERTLGENELVAAAQLALRLHLRLERAPLLEPVLLAVQEAFQKGDRREGHPHQGPACYSWRKLTHENIIADVDPDVHVESLRVAEAQRKRDFAKFSAFAQIAMQDPQTNRRYLLRRLGRISVVKRLSPLETTASERVILALLSLAGVIAASAMTGTPVDPNMVSSIVQVIVEAFVAFVLAHSSYTLFWKAQN
jgi:hypothetical protein